MAKDQCHTFFPSQDIKQNVFLSSYLHGWQGEKEGKVKRQKFEYLENEKSFLGEIKNIFHIFSRAIIWWKTKIS